MTPLDALIGAVDEAARHDPPASGRVAAALSAALGRSDLLGPRHRRASPYGYRTNLVHAAADGAWSVVAVVWLPGQSTAVHAHRSWSVVGVHEGEELESTYRMDDGPSGELQVHLAQRRLLLPGAVRTLAAGRSVHRLENTGDRMAVTIHVSGVDGRGAGGAVLDVYEPVSEPCAGAVGSTPA